MRDHRGQSEGRGAARVRWAGVTAAAGVVVSISAPAYADNPPPPPPGFESSASQPPPPGYGQPPPGYGQPPPQPPPSGYYGAPGGYGSPVMGPRVLDWEEGDPMRPGYHPETRIRKGLVVGGAVTFGVTYLFTALGGAIATDVARGTTSGSSSFLPLFVPAVGPFIAIGTMGANVTGGFFLALDGLAQSAGIAMFIYGIAAPKTVLVRNDVSKPVLRPVPMMVGGTSPGAGLVGTF
jgi:hypothetical protein